MIAITPGYSLLTMISTGLLVSQFLFTIGAIIFFVGKMKSTQESISSDLENTQAAFNKLLAEVKHDLKANTEAVRSLEVVFSRAGAMHDSLSDRVNVLEDEIKRWREH